MDYKTHCFSSNCGPRATYGFWLEGTGPKVTSALALMAFMMKTLGEVTLSSLWPVISPIQTINIILIGTTDLFNFFPDVGHL